MLCQKYLLSQLDNILCCSNIVVKIKKLVKLEIYGDLCNSSFCDDIIDQIEHHPRPPISLDKLQVESLTEKIAFLQEFLEGYKFHVVYNSEPDALEMRIADAAYAAEDAIESHIMDQIHGGKKRKKRINSVDFYQGLQRVLEDMDSLNKKVIEIKETMVVQHQLQRLSLISGGTLRSSFTWKNTTMVGFDDVLLEIMDKLTGGELDRHIIPIVGMGGSKFASSVTLLWNLHTLIIHQYSGSALFGIWELSQLRHVKAYRLSLLDPSSGRDDIVLENQQTLRKILNFECGQFWDDVLEKVGVRPVLRSSNSCTGPSEDASGKQLKGNSLA
ncbi:hypothetical protein ACS0TY_034951 [Phlomoides rotata]